MKLCFLMILSCFTCAFQVAGKTLDRGYTESVKYYDYVRKADWLQQVHSVEGWDWSLPIWVKPSPNSGVMSRIKPFPGQDLPFNRFTGLNATWASLEPEDGTYTFEGLMEKLDKMYERNIGVELHLRYCTYRTEYFSRTGDKIDFTKVIMTENGAAPEWLKSLYGVATQEYTPNTTAPVPFRITNYDIYDELFYARFFDLLEAMDTAGVFTHPAVKRLYLHEPSSTRGEEGAGPQPGEKNHVKYILKMEKWAEILGKDVSKLMYTGYSGKNLETAVKLGMGQRNGFVEMYLRHVGNPNLGLHLDESGYMYVDETYAPIKEARAWGDENEEYTEMKFHPRFGAIETFPQRYLSSSLMALVMRRNSLWEQGNAKTLNPELTAYVGLSLGKTSSDSPDAWCCLRESRVLKWDSFKDTLVYKNFERWLVQRDVPGAETVPVRPVPHGIQKLAADDFDYMARKGNRMFFWADDTFLKRRGRYSVKISHYDNTDIVMYVYTDSGYTKYNVPVSGSGRLHTSTVIVEGIEKSVSSKQPDIILEASGDMPMEVAMLRIVHIDPI